jgi:hypothetical protein
MTPKCWDQGLVVVVDFFFFFISFVEEFYMHSCVKFEKDWFLWFYLMKIILFSVCYPLA